MFDAATEFWRFSLTVYARPGVTSSCLALQDRFGLDVNLLLFCCWAAARGHRLDPAELAAAEAASVAWQRDIVTPLRGTAVPFAPREVDDARQADDTVANLKLYLGRVDGRADDHAAAALATLAA